MAGAKGQWQKLAKFTVDLNTQYTRCPEIDFFQARFRDAKTNEVERLRQDPQGLKPKCFPEK